MHANNNLGQYIVKRTLLATLLSLAAMSASSQATVLTTTYAATVAVGSDGNMFDVVTLGGALNVTAFDLNLDAGTWTIEVYEKAGTWVGFDKNAAAWTLIGSGSATSVAANTPTFFDVADFTLDATSTTGLYITTTALGMNYTIGTAVGNIAAANADLRILEGASNRYPFINTFTPRIWNGGIHYTAAAAVPEPATLALLGLGLAGLGFSRRRKGVGRVSAA